jgi:hypothetical protein
MTRIRNTHPYGMAGRPSSIAVRRVVKNVSQQPTAPILGLNPCWRNVGSRRLQKAQEPGDYGSTCSPWQETHWPTTVWVKPCGQALMAPR